MSLGKNIKWVMCIKMMYKHNDIKNVFQFQMVKFSNAKPQSLLHLPNRFNG